MLARERRGGVVGPEHVVAAVEEVKLQLRCRGNRQDPRGRLRPFQVALAKFDVERVDYPSVSVVLGFVFGGKSATW